MTLINNGDRITEKNSPDFTQAETVCVDDADAATAGEYMLNRGQKQIVLSMVLIGTGLLLLSLFFFDPKFLSAVFSNGFSGGTVVAILCFALPAAFFAVPGTIMLIKEVRLRNAAKNGSAKFYRFEVTDKKAFDSSGEENSSTTCYICFGGVMCRVGNREYERAKTMMYVYCAVISYKDFNYFCFYGTDFFGGKYNSR